MTFLTAAKLYGLIVVSFFVIDMTWLYLARGLYRKYLSHLMADKVLWPAAIVFYLAFMVGLIVFAVAPAIQEASPSRALVLGALFGFFTYATYDLTNLATLRNWPWQITCIDLVWGSVLCSVLARLGYGYYHWFLS